MGFRYTCVTGKREERKKEERNCNIRRNRILQRNETEPKGYELPKNVSLRNKKGGGKNAETIVSWKAGTNLKDVEASFSK